MIDLPKLLRELAKKRPVFHSEADMQHELAMQIGKTYPRFSIRLEYPMDNNTAIDIVIFNDGRKMALELKYLCRHLEHDINGEKFKLINQDAYNNRRYDVMKDIWRMEKFLEKHPAATADVLVVTNDPAYWEGPYKRNTHDAAFAIKKNRVVKGTLKWKSPETKGNRGEEIQLRGEYSIKWQKYSNIKDIDNGYFKFLHIQLNAGL
ncbi:MAG: hypothetical protein OXF45_04995 [Candidatus Dadabacteria bacterium]|nr:hypothetical protein [Candidatus Dadabacteria bacterium]